MIVLMESSPKEDCIPYSFVHNLYELLAQEEICFCAEDGGKVQERSSLSAWKLWEICREFFEGLDVTGVYWSTILEIETWPLFW